MHDSLAGKKYWWELAKKWQDVRYPTRPSKEDLKIYEGFLTKEKRWGKNLKILVLGATPEMRDLAAKYGSEVVVCDLNLDMIIAMTELMKRKNEQEIWVKTSWATVPLKHDYFDIVLGDGVNSHIPAKEVKFWWKHMSDLLKPRGIFISRIFVLPKSYRDCKIVEKEGVAIFNKIIKSIIKKKEPTKEELAALNIVLQLLSYNKNTETVTNAKFKELYFKHIKSFSIPLSQKKKIFTALSKIYPSFLEKTWRAPIDAEEEKIASKYFNIISKKGTIDKFSSSQQLQHVYLFRKK